MTLDERAAQLHREAIVIDTMSLLGPDVYTKEMLAWLDEAVARSAPTWQVALHMQEMQHRALLDGELPGYWEGWEEAGVDVASVTLGAFGEKPFTYDNAIADLAQMTETFDRLPDRLVKILTADDIVRAKRDRRRGVILNFQNTAHFGDDLGLLERFYELGLRIIQLTYNQRNLVGDGCTERNPAGLSRFGVGVVKRMNELGILVDLGHCSNPTSLDAIEASERPVAVTHATCASVVAHDRGKSDDVLRAIGESGGYFGVCIVPFFISTRPDPSLDEWLRHIDRVVQLAGVEHVGIGTDWGTELPPQFVHLLNDEMRRFGFREEHRVDWGATVDGFRTWRDWPNLTRSLLEHGYSDDEVRGLIGGNFLRMFREAVG